MNNGLRVRRQGAVWIGTFRAMASPCEVHLELRSKRLAMRLMEMAQQEALRIERLLSRYRDDNVIHRINTAAGMPVTVDAETARMLDFAATCFQASDGLFDVTSGVLREVWTFDGSDNVPTPAEVEPLLSRIGWQHVRWENPHFCLPAGMQIDLGGIGKEYAVDKTLAMLQARSPGACMVNFGGDLHASDAPADAESWTVGIEKRDHAGETSGTVQLVRGALATSGDARRFLLRNGIRYSHVLNPLTGWPVQDAPASVTVAADTCTEAGILSTLALLHGKQAESFLEAHQLAHWIQR